MLSEFEAAQLFASDSYLKTLLVFRFLTSGIGLVCLIALERNQKKFVAHSSLKLLLNIHGFWNLLLCCSTFAESSLQIYAHLTIKDPSDLLLTTNQCLLRMIPQFFGISGSISSMLVMSFERYDASRNISTYESSSKYNGLKFVGLHILLTLLGVFVDAVKYDFPTRVPHCCVASVEGKNIQTVLTGAFFLCALFTIYLSLKLLKGNKLLHNSEESMGMTLSERYQLSENIRVLQLLLPIVISHTSITMAGSVGYFYFEFGGFQKEYYPILEDTINMVFLQGVAMPLIFLHRYRGKRFLESQAVITNKARGEKLVSAHDRVIMRGW